MSRQLSVCTAAAMLSATALFISWGAAAAPGSELSLLADPDAIDLSAVLVYKRLSLEPSGDDDTEALQAALDQCSGNKARCAIQLQAGDFHTNMLVAYDFNGVIMGRGADRTRILPVDDETLKTNDADPFFTVEPTTDEPYPFLMTFVDGRVTLADLAFEFPDGPLDIDPWFVCGPLEEVIAGAVVATGRKRMDLRLSNIAITGGLYDFSPAFGRNTFNGAFYESLLYPEGIPYPDWCAGEPLSDLVLIGGRYTVSGSTFINVLDPMPVIGAADLKVTISNNHVSGALFGVDIQLVRDSDVSITNNFMDVQAAGVEIVQGYDVLVFDGSRFFVHNNDITVNSLGDSLFGPFSGVEYLDFAFDGASDDAVEVVANTIYLGIDALDGVYILGDEGTARIVANEISGLASYAGVDVDASTGCQVAGNRFPGLTTGLANIYLSPTTSGCHVVAPEGDVLDDGTDNNVITP